MMLLKNRQSNCQINYQELETQLFKNRLLALVLVVCFFQRFRSKLLKLIFPGTVPSA